MKELSKPIDEIKNDIERARRFMLAKFPRYVNEKETPSHFMAQKRWLVEFPDVDTCEVTPVSYGQPIHAAVAEFRLSWVNGKPVWKGNFALRTILYNEAPIAIHKVPDDV